ncbi:MAG: hypothetical protein HDQ97_12105 [Lachnospiraceae bacterium]|nr:hypothetical protein [Lachnospiraceae bacterium]
MLIFRPKFYMFDENGNEAYNLYRNVARFYLENDILKDNEFYCTYVFKLAKACEMVGDFLGAEMYLNYLKQNYFEWNTENVTIECDHLKIRCQRKSVDVECDDQRLKRILQNLVSVFFNINKNINAFIVENEEEYKTLAVSKLGYVNEMDINPYSGWNACGFYERPCVHCLVFKRSAISDNDDALAGLCAHELAHFELYDTQTVQKTLHNYERGDIYLFREWTTDIQVIQRGFAFELFMSRKHYPDSETRILTSKDIEYLVQKIADYSETL